MQEPTPKPGETDVPPGCHEDSPATLDEMFLGQCTIDCGGQSAVSETFEPKIYEHGPAFSAVNYGIANCAAVAVKGGYVVIDTTSSVAEAIPIREALEHAMGRTRVSGIVYTHGHWDHARGTPAFWTEGVPIWATNEFVEHLRCEGRTPNAHYERGAKQFGYGLPDDQVPSNGIGPALRIRDKVVAPLKMPTNTFQGQTTFNAGGTDFVLQSAPGETIDQLFVWVPKLRTLHVGDNLYRAFPNLYAIRGVPPRPVEQWIQSLDAMRRLVPRPEFMMLGHTEPIYGADAIYEVLTDYRDAIAFVHDSVLRLMEAGRTPDEMVEEIQLPRRFRDHPYLVQQYGTLKSAIRGIYAGYWGWFDGRANSLNPLTQVELAERIIPAMGGRNNVVEMIGKAMESNDYRWALWLADHSLAVKNDRSVRGLKVQTLEQMAQRTSNPLMRCWYLSEAAQSSGQWRKRTMPKIAFDSIAEMPIEQMIEAMPRRLNRRSRRRTLSFAFRFIDSGKDFTFHIRRGVGEVVHRIEGEPYLTIETTEADFKALGVNELKPIQPSFYKRIGLQIPDNKFPSPVRKLFRLAVLGYLLDRPS